MEQFSTKSGIFGSEMSLFKIKTSVMRCVQEIICQEPNFVKWSFDKKLWFPKI